jgi:hypothetical protein
MSFLLNKLSVTDHGPLVLPNQSSGDQISPQPKASSDQIVPQHEKATLEVAKRFIKVIVFTKSSWPILSDDKYSMVEEPLK